MNIFKLIYHVIVDYQHNQDHTDDKFILSLFILPSWSDGRSIDFNTTIFVVQGLNTV